MLMQKSLLVCSLVSMVKGALVHSVHPACVVTISLHNLGLCDGIRC